MGIASRRNHSFRRTTSVNKALFVQHVEQSRKPMSRVF